MSEIKDLIIQVGQENFQSEVVDSDVPVLVDFWAPWCGPCRQLEPAIEAIAEEHQGNLKVAKLNIDEDPAIAGAYGVMSIPSVIVFRNGEATNRAVGAMPRKALQQQLGLS